MESVNKDGNMAALGVDLGLQNRFGKGKNRLQSGRENSRESWCVTRPGGGGGYSLIWAI